MHILIMTQQLSLDWVQLQLYAIIEPVSSEHTHRISLSLSLSPYKRLRHPQANDHVQSDEKPELFCQKLIDRILLFCSSRKLPGTQKEDEQIFVGCNTCESLFLCVCYTVLS